MSEIKVLLIGCLNISNAQFDIGELNSINLSLYQAHTAALLINNSFFILSIDYFLNKTHCISVTRRIIHSSLL